MKCLDCHDSLQRRLDGDRNALTADVVEHLSQCASCRRELAAAEQFLRGVAAMPRPECPPDFAQRMVGLVLRDMAPAEQETVPDIDVPEIDVQDLALQSLAAQEEAVPLPRQPRHRSRVRVRLAIGFAMAASVLLIAGYFL